MEGIHSFPNQSTVTEHPSPHGQVPLPMATKGLGPESVPQLCFLWLLRGLPQVKEQERMCRDEARCRTDVAHAECDWDAASQLQNKPSTQPRPQPLSLQGGEVTQPDVISRKQALCRTWPLNDASVQLILPCVIANESSLESPGKNSRNITELWKENHEIRMFLPKHILEYLRFLSLNSYCNEISGRERSLFVDKHLT